MPYLLFKENKQIKYLRLVPGLSIRAGCSPDCNLPLPPDQCAPFRVADDGHGHWTLYNLNPPETRTFESAPLTGGMMIPMGNIHLHFREEFEESRGIPVTESLRFAEGQTLEHYTIRSLLSETSPRSRLYLAKSSELPGDRILKVFRKQLDSSEEEEYCRLMEKIQEYSLPGISSVHDAGIFNRNAWYASDYYPDPNLEFRISAKAPMSPSEAAGILSALIYILNHALQETGMFHGSLTPDGILYKENSKLLLTDFGLFDWKSRILCGGAPCISPWYVSPEQISGGDITWKSDQYSLGIILFRMLTGVLPYHSTDPEVLYGMHLFGPFPLPKERNPNVEISSSMLEVLLRMTARDPDLRYASWDALRKDL